MSDFYKLYPFFIFQQDNDDPMAHIHFTAEGEVTFKSILFVPTSAPRGLFDEYGSKKNDYIKVCTLSNIYSTDLFNFFSNSPKTEFQSKCLPFAAVCQESFHHRRLQWHDAQVPELHQGSGELFLTLIWSHANVMCLVSAFTCTVTKGNFILLGWLWRPSSECVQRNSAAAQTAQGELNMQPCSLPIPSFSHH